MENLARKPTIQNRKQDNQGIRWYEVDGKEYISVTAVLGNWVPIQLKKWFINKKPEEIEKRRKETADKGSELHAKAEAGTEDRVTSLLQSEGMEILEQEIVVCSEDGWAGTVDVKVKQGDRILMLDIKTGRFGPTAGAQLGAYSLTDPEVTGFGVIKLPRDEKQPAQFFDYSANFDNCRYAWGCIFDYWKFQNYKQLSHWEFFGKRTAAIINVSQGR